MPEAPDKDLEPTIGLDGIRAVMVPIEHDESRMTRIGAPALLEVGNGAGRSTTAENDSVALDASRKRRIESPGPTSEYLAITRALDIEHERAVALFARRARRSGGSF